jgi:hypothetical protein
MARIGWVRLQLNDLAVGKTSQGFATKKSGRKLRESPLHSGGVFSAGLKSGFPLLKQGAST